MNSPEIRGARARLGLSQKNVADELGISAASYQKKESGLIKFSDSERIKLAKVLGLTPVQMNDFLFDSQLPIGKEQSNEW